jgi:DNA-binding Lrp family transcriptional regulator
LEALFLVSAFILLNTDLGAQTKVLDTVKHLEGVVEAHGLVSVYDLALKVKTSSAEALKELVVFSIRRLSGVSNVTMLLVED